jgi:hypothetical protein
MKYGEVLLSGAAMLVAAVAPGRSAWAATTVQIGSSGKTFASSAVQCVTNPTGVSAPMVQAGLFNPKPTTTAVVSLNGTVYGASVTAAEPVADVWLAVGSNKVVVALSKKVADAYTFNVNAGMCNLPDTSGNWFSPDGTLEYAASGKSYATVTPGCALNGRTGLTQPYVNLFDNGGFLLNVSVNGVPLTQLSATRPHTPVFLSAGMNVISAANGSLSTDYYVRGGGNGTCALP